MGGFDNVFGESSIQRMMFCLLFTFLLAFSNGFVVDNEWESFKQVWGKEYQSTEDSMRRSIWERNKAMVESHNKKAEKSFTMALNEALTGQKRRWSAFVWGILMWTGEKEKN